MKQFTKQNWVALIATAMLFICSLVCSPVYLNYAFSEGTAAGVIAAFACIVLCSYNFAIVYDNIHIEQRISLPKIILACLATAVLVVIASVAYYIECNVLWLSILMCFAGFICIYSFFRGLKLLDAMSCKCRATESLENQLKFANEHIDQLNVMLGANYSKVKELTERTSIATRTIDAQQAHIQQLQTELDKYKAVETKRQNGLKAYNERRRQMKLDAKLD